MRYVHVACQAIHRAWGQIFAVIAMVILLCPAVARAHNPNETYIYLDIDSLTIGGLVEMRLQDLDAIFDLDRNGNGAVSDAEFDAGKPAILDHFQSAMSFDLNGATPMILFDEVTRFDGGIGTFMQLNFTLDYKGAVPDQIAMTYDSQFDGSLENHRAMVLLRSNVKTGLENNEAHISHIFAPGPNQVTLSLTSPPAGQVFALFVKHGLVHILIGFDHVAFLLALLLPSVLVVQAGRWAPAATLGQAGWTILKIATVFTLAHSITLSAAALGIIVPPAQMIEALIALSIVAAALVNITLVRPTATLPMVFALGLLHGFGFSYVMEPLGIARATLLHSLLGFNIGVELGQIAIIAVVFPPLFVLRRQGWYVAAVLKGGSVLLILIATWWFGERALGLVQSAMAAG